MKIGACVILYHPDQIEINNIISYSHAVQKVYVFDNSEQYNNREAVLALGDNISYFHEGENLGISKRLNQACEMAQKEGLDFMLTMDQDSYFSKECLTHYLLQIKSCDNIDTIGMFGVNHSTIEKKCDTDTSPIERYNLITSGSVVNLKAFQHTNGFDENLFIDGVDFDFCFELKRCGYKCLFFKDTFLVHSLGEQSKRRTFKSLYLIAKEKTIYSNTRLYYMIRNMYYMENKYKNLFPELLEDFKKSQNTHINSNFYYSNNLVGFLKTLIKAKRDYKNNKMGKIDR